MHMQNITITYFCLVYVVCGIVPRLGNPSFGTIRKIQVRSGDSLLKNI